MTDTAPNQYPVIQFDESGILWTVREKTLTPYQHLSHIACAAAKCAYPQLLDYSKAQHIEMQGYQGLRYDLGESYDHHKIIVAQCNQCSTAPSTNNTTEQKSSKKSKKSSKKNAKKAKQSATSTTPTQKPVVVMLLNKDNYIVLKSPAYDATQHALTLQSYVTAILSNQGYWDLVNKFKH
ncbi:MAG: hypothetical protein Q4D05_03080 [Acinetobacter sp.]|nr:hypothetical protein [Acinetobacter sp.]